MRSPSTIDVLNRLLALHHRSLAVYLCDAAPWMTEKDQRTYATIRQIADDHRAASDRLAQLVLELDGRVDLGEFPLAFTGYNDLSIDFLVRKLTESQKRDIRVIDECIEQLSTAPLAKAIAQELRGAALGHLDSLQELLQSATSPVGHGTV